VAELLRAMDMMKKTAP